MQGSGKRPNGTLRFLFGQVGMLKQGCFQNTLDTDRNRIDKFPLRGIPRLWHIQRLDWVAKTFLGGKGEVVDILFYFAG